MVPLLWPIAIWILILGRDLAEVTGTFGAPASEDFSPKNRYFSSHPTCFASTRSYGRKSDRDRHTRKHGSVRIPCPAVGCKKAFYRPDKLLDHRRKKHDQK